MRITPHKTLFAIFLACFISAKSMYAQGEDLTVFAAASLSDAMNEIGARFQAQHGGHVHFNLAGSNTLARQIVEGAPADVFFSADEAKMDDLAKRSLIDASSRRSLLSNTLVVIVNARRPAPLQCIEDLASPAFAKIALAQTDTVPAGVYSKKYLTAVGLWKMVQPKVVETENVRAALAAVSSDNADAGIVYKTDALISHDVQIALQISAEAGPKISYPVAVLKSTAHSDTAHEFVRYLTSSEAQAIFKRLGFTPLK